MSPVLALHEFAKKYRMEDEEMNKSWDLHTCKQCPYPSGIILMCNHERRYSNRPKTATFKCESNAPEMLQCEHCLFESELKVSLQHHINVHHREKKQNFYIKNVLKPYKCKDCDFQTYALLMVTKHMHSFDHVFNENANAKSDLKMHVKEEEVQWFECDQCTSKCKQKTSLKKHIRRQHSDDILWFKCEQCSFKTKWGDSLKYHIMSKHTDTKDMIWFKCELCSHKTINKYSLNKHIKFKHTKHIDAQWYQCQQCSYKSMEKTGLKRHVQYRHVDEKEAKWFECARCTFKSRHKVALQRHMVMHTGTKDHECQQCSYKAKTKRNLGTHIAYVHGKAEDKWFECGQCGYKTMSQWHFKSHVKNCKYADVKDAVWFACTQCTFRSKSKLSLARHTKYMH